MTVPLERGTGVLGAGAPGAVVRVLELPDGGALAVPEQFEADLVLADLEAATMRALAAGHPNPGLLSDEAVMPGVSTWMAMRKLAIALHPLYEARTDLATLGAGLQLDELHRALPDGRSPFEAVASQYGDARAAQSEADYARFLLGPYTPSCRVLVQGSQDSRALRWRADAARFVALDHGARWTGPVSLISLACGAAGPVARIADGLAARGQVTAEVVLVDVDPVALAAGRAIAGRHVEDSVVGAHQLNLIDASTRTAAHLVPALGAGRAHLVDILGLFEYLPDRVAVDMLARVRPLLRPDGVIVVGNMIDVRPGQNMFAHVIRWPRLVQRSVPRLLAVAAAAGFGAGQVEVVVPPAHDAVYAVALLRP